MAGKHEEIIPSLSEQDAQKLERAHKLADRPEKFAEMFEQVAKTQTKVKDVLKKEIRDIIGTDTETRGSIKGLVRQTEKENLWYGLKLVGFGLWSIGLLALGAILNRFIK